MKAEASFVVPCATLFVALGPGVGCAIDLMKDINIDDKNNHSLVREVEVYFDMLNNKLLSSTIP